jgi:hypothetical protein
LSDNDVVTIDVATLTKIIEGLSKVAALDAKIDGTRALLDTQTQNLQNTLSAVKHSVEQIQVQLAEAQRKDAISRSECDQLRQTCCDKQTEVHKELGKKQGWPQGLVIVVGATCSLISLALGTWLGQVCLNLTSHH